MTPQERAAAGAALLDTEMPGWANRLKMDRFDIGSNDQCILGQLFPVTRCCAYHDGVQALHPDGPWHDTWAANHGFDMTTDRQITDDDWRATLNADQEALNVAWRDLVEARI